MADLSQNIERAGVIVRTLVAAKTETSVAEFKTNQSDADMLGKLISSLANSARLLEERAAYVVWGVEDAGKTIVGTSFDVENTFHKNQPLQIWLSQRFDPVPDLKFQDLSLDGKRVVLLTIQPASVAPIEFEHTAYIRVGSVSTRLSQHREKQQSLWAKLQIQLWEENVAASFVPAEDVLNLLDYKGYLKLTDQPNATSPLDVLNRMVGDKLIREDVGGRYDILNLGAILYAHRLSSISDTLARKAVRFNQYDGNSRANTVSRRQDGEKGYASSLVGLVDYLAGVLPINEVISGAFRTESKLFPEIAIRELVANAFIHQDMTETGAGPIVDLFKDRIEITNPGRALIPTRRFLDSSPRSRNERLARMMRRMKLCEESGTGIDKVYEAVELYQLPPLDLRQEPAALRAVLYAPRAFAEMTPEERVRACYQHADLEHVNNRRMTNASLRKRFGLDDSNSSSTQVSKIIRTARDENLIRSDDGDASRSYIPVWDDEKG